MLRGTARVSSVSPGGASSGGIGGRLSLVTATPVMVSTQSAKNTVFWTPYYGNMVPLWNGSSFVPTACSELSNLSTATSVGNAGPAAVANSSVYDYYLWLLNGTTATLTRSPAWTSGTSRGSGAGTAQQTMVQGILTNTVAITNGPAAGFGTYVGTALSNGSALFDWIYGAFANGWTAAAHNLWNMYNRVDVAGVLGDTTGSWTYNSTTYRAPNANTTTARVGVVRGQDEDAMSAWYATRGTNGSSTSAAIVGIGLDSTSALSGNCISQIPTPTVNLLSPISAKYDGYPGLGSHFLSALEAMSAAFSGTFLGQGAGPPATNSGMQYHLRA